MPLSQLFVKLSLLYNNNIAIYVNVVCRYICIGIYIFKYIFIDFII